MDEILPGVWHWTAEHPDIETDVSSYYLEDAGVVLDPLWPEGGREAFGDWAVQQIVLTCKGHTRQSPELQEAFGARIRAPRVALGNFQGQDFEVEPFDWGDEVAPGVRSIELGAIAPDDGVLHIHAGLGALHFADGLLVRDGELSLMPDSLMDDPDTVKQKSLARLQELLELDFDALLFAHSDPVASGGRDQLADFVSRNRR